MIFAYATDERTLMVFPTEADTIAYCEGVDIEEGGWLFFDADGQPLDAVFITPNKRGAFTVISGDYVLRPTSKTSIKPLLNHLGEVAAVEGMPPLNTVAEVKRLLTIRSSGTPAGKPAGAP